MKQILLIVDVQSAFSPPDDLIAGINSLLPLMPSVATVEQHDEAAVPFAWQHHWQPPATDESLIAANRIFVKHGYGPPDDLMAHLKRQAPERVLVCGIQTDTCVLAAGFALFDAGLQPTLIASLTRGSSLDRSGGLGVRLWRHHFSNVIEDHRTLLSGD